MFLMLNRENLGNFDKLTLFTAAYEYSISKKFPIQQLCQIVKEHLVLTSKSDASNTPYLLMMKSSVVKIYLFLNRFDVKFRFRMRPFCLLLDDACKREIISKDPLGLLVLTDPDDELRRYAAICHSSWFLYKLHKEPLECQMHPNLKNVRLFVGQDALKRNAYSELRDFADLQLTDDELLWYLRACIQLSKNKLRSPRFLKNKASLLDNLLMTSQHDLDEAREVAGDMDGAIQLDDWRSCVCATLFRYCLELKHQGSPKHQRDIDYVLKKIMCVRPLMQYPMGRFLTKNPYRGYQGVVHSMYTRGSHALLMDMHQWQGAFITEQYLNDAQMRKNPTQHLDGWVNYWSFVIEGSPLMQEWVRTTGRPPLIPLLPYNLLSVVLSENAELNVSFLTSVRSLFQSAVKHISQHGELSAYHFGVHSAFVMECLLPYVQDDRLSGLSSSEQCVLQEQLQSLIDSLKTA